MTTALANLRVTTDLVGACKKADLIIEAVPEHMLLKHDLFTQVEAVAKPCVNQSINQ